MAVISLSDANLPRMARSFIMLQTWRKEYQRRSVMAKRSATTTFAGVRAYYNRLPSKESAVNNFRSELEFLRRLRKESRVAAINPWR